jgi:oligosaccharide repeat unit polymerase
MFNILNINVDLTFLFAALLLVAILFIFKYFEKSFFPPASIFFFAFISSTFLYSYSIIKLEVYSPSINYDNMGVALTYSLLSFFFLAFGYIVYNTFYFGRKKEITVLSKPIFSLKTIPFAYFLLFIFIIVNVINHPLFSGHDVARGENSYLNDEDISLWYRISFISSQLVVPLSISILISSMSFNLVKAKQARFISFIGLGIVILLTLLSFDRHAAVSSLLLIILLYHFRISKLKIRTGVFFFLGLLLLQTTRLLRGIGSYGNLTVSDLILILSEVDFSLIIIGPFTALGGWDVFTNVFDLVPSLDNYKLGSTYISSFLGLFSPRVLGIGSYSAVTPSRWYMELYSPGTTNHGFDFSLLAETYINFGYFGPLFFIPLGFFIGYLSYKLRYTNSSFTLFFSLLAIEALTFGVRMDSNSILKGMFFKFIPILVLAFIFNLITTNKNGKI